MGAYLTDRPRMVPAFDSGTLGGHACETTRHINAATTRAPDEWHRAVCCAQRPKGCLGSCLVSKPRDKDMLLARFKHACVDSGLTREVLCGGSGGRTGACLWRPLASATAEQGPLLFSARPCRATGVPCTNTTQMCCSLSVWERRQRRPRIRPAPLWQTRAGGNLR